MYVFVAFVVDRNGYNSSMTKRTLLALLVSALAIFGAARFLHAQEKLPYPETQKVIMENQFVRVFDVRVPAGTAEPRHSHGRGVTVALTEYDNETKQDGAQWVKSHTKFGEVKLAEPVTHEARNSGTTEQHVIRIELK